jgi:hypothetical protein
MQALEPVLNSNFFPDSDVIPDRGAWMQTYSGGRFFPFDPRPEEVDIIDIAHALSFQPRYTGHCSRHYSVAEHSILVSELVPPEDALAGLLHDATEAYLADLSRPVKRILGSSNLYFELEDRVAAVIFKKYGVTHMPTSVKEADIAICLAEKRKLLARAEHWDIPFPEPKVSILAMPPVAARALFIRRFCQLLGVSHDGLFQRLDKLHMQDNLAFNTGDIR